MEELDIYAPVVIPTLCRFEHFKRCVESLKNCSGAQKTELIIGLDYPKKTEHWEGYRKISEYVETISGFLKVTVLRADHNFGVGPNGNMNRLNKYARERYDRVIGTEDDNEFSPDFLEYMNKSLNKYKENPKVFAICGYNYPIDMGTYNKNVYASHEFSGWGTGRWFNKRFTINRDVMKSYLYSPKALFTLIRKRPGIVLTLIDMLNKNALWGDTCHVVLAYVNDFYTITPSISMVRNHGHDGTGEHCGATDLYINQKIDHNLDFELDDIDIIQPKIKGLHDYFSISAYSFIRMIKWLLCFYYKDMFSKKK